MDFAEASEMLVDAEFNLLEASVLFKALFNELQRRIFISTFQHIIALHKNFYLLFEEDKIAAKCSEALEAKAALFRLKISSSPLLLLLLLISEADNDEANDLECNLREFLFLGGLTFMLP